MAPASTGMASISMGGSSASTLGSQWRCAYKPAPPRMTTLGTAAASTVPSTPAAAPSGGASTTIPFGIVPGSATVRLVQSATRSVELSGATIRGTSVPSPLSTSGPLSAQDALERQQSRNTLKGGGSTPRAAATPHGGATPQGGTPRCRSRPHTSEACSPSRPAGVCVVTSAAAWRVASPRHAAESPGSPALVATSPVSHAPVVQRPRFISEQAEQAEQRLPMTASRRLESPQLSVARFESPSASPSVGSRGFPAACTAGSPALAASTSRSGGEAESADAARQRGWPAILPGSAQHPVASQQGCHQNSSPPCRPVVPVHERACRSPQSPPIGGATASTPAVSSTAEAFSSDTCSRSSGALLTGNASSSSAPGPGSPLSASPTNLPTNGSAFHSPLVSSGPGSCPILQCEESVLYSPRTAIPPDKKRDLRCDEASVESAQPLTSTSRETESDAWESSGPGEGAPPTPSPEDVPPWRAVKQSSGLLHSPAPSPVDSETLQDESCSVAADVADDARDERDVVDHGAGMLQDIGWTPSFHSLAVASPGTIASTALSLPPDPCAADPVCQTSAEEEAARAMVRDIEAAAARAVSEKWAAVEVAPVPAEVPKSFVMRWDGKDWVPITQSPAEKVSGWPVEGDAERVLEELRSSINYEATERRRLEALQCHNCERLAEYEKRLADLQGNLEEANSQRDSLQRQLKDKSDQHSELVKRFRRYQDANKCLEEDLSRAADTRKRLEMQAKQEHLGKVAAEQLAKELQQKVRDFEKEVTAVAAEQLDASAKVPAELEDQLEKLRRQLEETVRTVQLRCGGGTASGDLSKAAAVAAAATRGLAGTQHLSPSTLLLLEERPKNSADISGCWAGADESTAMSTEEELPTTEEQLLGEWSSTSLQVCESNHDRGSGDIASLDVDESLRVLPNGRRLRGAGSSVDSLGGASIGSPASGAPPSEIDEGDGTVVLPLQAESDDFPTSSPSASRGGQIQITLSLRDLSEIKALKKPPPPIRMLMEVCCLLFHIQPVKQPDERNAKRYKLDYWEPARRYLLSDPFFLSKLRMYEADDISQVQRLKIKKYFQDPEFAPDRVKNCSKAAHELYEWVSQLVQPEVNCADGHRGPLPIANSRHRESPPCARMPLAASLGTYARNTL